MKKVKIVLLMMFVVMMLACTGCSIKNNVSMTEEGKGTQEAKIGISKDIYNKEYVKVSNINDIANIVRQNVDDSITITTETGSSQDYIVASFNYDTVQDMDCQIKKLVNQMIDSRISEQDFLGLYNEDIDVLEKYEESYITAIKELLDNNKIEYDVNSKGFKSFIEVFDKKLSNVAGHDVMCDSNDSYYDARDEFVFVEFLYDKLFFDEESYLATSITKNGDNSLLKIGFRNMNALPIYVYSIMAFNADAIYDMDTMIDKIAVDYLVEEKNKYLNIFDKLDLANNIKNVLGSSEALLGKENISFNNITEEQAEEMFSYDDAEYIYNNFNSNDGSYSIYDYNDRYGIDLTKEFSDTAFLYMNAEAGLHELTRDFVNTITFGKQTVSMELNSMDDITDEEGYITIDSEKGLVKAVKNNTNAAGTDKTVDMDETPATADNFQLLLVGGIAVMAALLGVAFYIRRKSY